MAISPQVISRLKSQLLTSGLQQKDNPLFQVINQLIGALGDTAQVAASGGSGGGGTGPAGPAGANGNTFYGLDGEDGNDGQPGIMGPQGFTGPTGPQGSPGIPIHIPAYDGIDGVDGFPIPGPRGLIGPTGNTGPTGPIGPRGIDGIDGQDFYYQLVSSTIISAFAGGNLQLATLSISTSDYRGIATTPLTIINAAGTKKLIAPVGYAFIASVGTAFSGVTIQPKWQTSGSSIGSGIGGPSTANTTAFRLAFPASFNFSTAGNTAAQENDAVILTASSPGSLGTIVSPSGFTFFMWYLLLTHA